MKDGTYLEEVRDQYEDFPYPPRDIKDEYERIIGSRASSLDCLNHYCFGGERNFDDNFSVLVAGGGTGDCTIYLAEQLRHTRAKIVYLDMSLSSMKIAKGRAEVRGLENITWIHDSIYNIPDLDLGLFDYIACTGVLHHLDDPEKGLGMLHSVLKDEGSINVMVYGTYGRTPIYQLQDLMRRVNLNAADSKEKISNTRQVLSALPSTNWFKFNGVMFNKDLSTDEGLYDLLLHSQDRSYTVPEFYQFAESQGLVLHTLLEGDHPMGQLLFDPRTFVKDKALLEKINALPVAEQHAICELLFGQMIKQNGYMAKTNKKPASPDNKSLIPVLSTFNSETEQRKKLISVMNSDEARINLNAFMGINRTPLTAGIFNAIDNKRSIEEIITYAAESLSASPEQVESEFLTLFDILHKVSLVFLKSPGVGDYRTVAEMSIQRKGK